MTIQLKSRITAMAIVAALIVPFALVYAAPLTHAAQPAGTAGYVQSLPISYTLSPPTAANLQSLINGAQDGEVIDLAGQIVPDVDTLDVKTGVTIQNGTIELKRDLNKSADLSYIRISTSGVTLKGLKIVGYDAVDVAGTTVAGANNISVNCGDSVCDDINIINNDIVVGTEGADLGGVGGDGEAGDGIVTVGSQNITSNLVISDNIFTTTSTITPGFPMN